MAVPFDPRRLAIMGAGVPIVEGVLQSPSSGAAQYSLSATGSLAYIPGEFRQTNSGWCGSLATGQSSLWPLLRAPTCTRDSPPTANV